MKNNPLRLFVVSLLILFAEVMCIRWFAVEILSLRIFPNLTLMVIFIGVSVGLSTYKQALISPLVQAVAVVSTLACILLARPLHFGHLTFKTTPEILGSLLLLGFIVANLSTVFINLGRVLGAEFNPLPPLKAYSINLLGSLAGVVIFGLISLFCLPPFAWIAIATVLAYLLSDKKYVIAIGAILSIGAWFSYADGTWTPYGYIQIEPDIKTDNCMPVKGNYVLSTNGEYFHGGTHILAVPSYQAIADVCKNLTQLQRDYRYGLELPFVMGNKFDSVLVLGSGSGNDVQTAMQHGAKHIDAVEIDPFIASCGRKKHPDRPYLNDKVSVHVEDARTFLRSNEGKYDLIQFAFLDPGVTLRVSSFLRLDNFVYTVESFRGALRHLNPDGVVSLAFATGGGELATKRLYATITEACGKPPLCLVHDSTGCCYFFFGPGVKPLPDNVLMPDNLRIWPSPDEYTGTRASTDDWPFLYLDFNRSAIYIYFFVLASATFLPLSVLFKGISGKLVVNEVVPMFFLGMAFMLMETKSITALSLLFGSTWIVSSLVITLILLLACLANWSVDKLKIDKVAPFYACLVVSLLFDYYFHVPSSSSLHPLLLDGISAFICCLPVFFGGIIFSILLKRTTNAVLPLSANILGVAFGGLLENLCVLIGIKGLSLIALGIYLLSGLPLLRSKESSTTKAERNN